MTSKFVLVAFEPAGRALSCKRFDLPAWQKHLQVGLFSVPTSGPQLVHERLWYVLSCLWESAYKRSFAAYQNE